jgi:hypothetical protein
MLKLRNAVYKFMYGRYGHDRLNYFIIIFAMALSIVSALFFKGNPFISLFVYGLLIVSMLRMLSRKASKQTFQEECYRQGPSLLPMSPMRPESPRAARQGKGRDLLPVLPYEVLAPFLSRKRILRDPFICHFSQLSAKCYTEEKKTMREGVWER